ncbi:Hypothetical predicted protein, partial [Podarcis lilfordi]
MQQQQQHLNPRHLVLAKMLQRSQEFALPLASVSHASKLEHRWQLGARASLLLKKTFETEGGNKTGGACDFQIPTLDRNVPGLYFLFPFSHLRSFMEPARFLGNVALEQKRKKKRCCCYLSAVNSLLLPLNRLSRLSVGRAGAAAIIVASSNGREGGEGRGLAGRGRGGLSRLAAAALGSTLFSMLMRAERRLVDIYVEAGAAALHFSTPPPLLSTWFSPLSLSLPPPFPSSPDAAALLLLPATSMRGEGVGRGKRERRLVGRLAVRCSSPSPLHPPPPFTREPPHAPQPARRLLRRPLLRLREGEERERKRALCLIGRDWKE